MKKIKLVPYPVLRKKAVTVFNAWIRNRDPKCITCGEPTQNAGHFIHENCFDFNPEILHGQCVRCNKWLSGNLGVYTMKMIEMYGIEQVERWHEMKHEIVKFSRELLEDIIKNYKL